MFRKKNPIIPICGLLLIALASSCTQSADIAYVDKDKKAIVSTKGDPFKKIMISGAGKQVVFESYGNIDQQNAVIYFYKVNPGFMVSEGFGLNKNYILKLAPNSKYTVYIYKNPQDQPAYPLYFHTDLNNNIVVDADKE